MSDEFCTQIGNMLCIDGKRFSKETVKAALAAHCKPEPYIFKAGDVVRTADGYIRIFFEDIEGNLRVMDGEGEQVGAVTDEQEWAENNNYVKIGELLDYLPKDE